MNRKKENIIICDFNPPKIWDFAIGLENVTKISWKRIIYINNKNKGRFAKYIRYIKYFFLSIKLFKKRDNFSYIITWQQFYGLLYSFFCKFFNVKKKNNLFIMTFIYIPKKGIIGKLYKNFVKYSAKSKYVDKIFVFSSSEAKKYNLELGISLEKFSFLLLGENLIKKEYKINFENNFILSSGYSNRDFDFLISVLVGKPYTVRIYGNRNFHKKNIIMSDEVIGDKISSILNKCKIVAVPLKENREAGQLTILHAMQAGIPVIATDTDCMRDYIQNGVNGFLCKNEKDEWLDKISLLYRDDALYKKMSLNCKKIYKKNHTLFVFGKNIGLEINNYFKGGK